MPDIEQPTEGGALQRQVDELRDRLARLEVETQIAKEEAHQAREEVLNLHEQLAAAERDQQDLRTTRARLARIKMRGLFARIRNRT